MPDRMPSSIEPMKARIGEPGAGVEWQFEVKWDGYRAIAFCGGKFRLQGRRLNAIGADYPEIAGLGDDPAADGLILDGELVVFDEAGRPDFQLMQARRDLGLKAHFLVFDLLWSAGRDLRGRPYRERRERLEQTGLEGERWSVPDRIEGDLGDVMEATAGLGLEGVVAKDPESPYVEGSRSGYWLKVKNTNRQEFVVGGWTSGKGHRSGTLGSLLVGYRDRPGGRLRYAGRVGTGMDDRLLRRLAGELAAEERADPPFVPEDLGQIPRGAHWCEPRLVIEVRFTQWTRDGRLRNPVFLGFRPDKPAAEVVREA